MSILGLLGYGALRARGVGDPADSWLGGTPVSQGVITVGDLTSMLPCAAYVLG